MARMRIVALVLGLSIAAAHAGEFVPGTEDLPLMPGLAPVAAKSLVFDEPEGRIVEAEAKGTLGRAAVLDFYGTTLPQLGWAASGPGAWKRDGEVLRLTIAGHDGALTVGFTLSPLKEPRP